MSLKYCAHFMYIIHRTLSLHMEARPFPPFLQLQTRWHVVIQLSQLLIVQRWEWTLTVRSGYECSHVAQQASTVSITFLYSIYEPPTIDGDRDSYVGWQLATRRTETDSEQAYNVDSIVGDGQILGDRRSWSTKMNARRLVTDKTNTAV